MSTCRTQGPHRHYVMMGSALRCLQVHSLVHSLRARGRVHGHAAFLSSLPVGTYYCHSTAHSSVILLPFLLPIPSTAHSSHSTSVSTATHSSVHSTASRMGSRKGSRMTLEWAVGWIDSIRMDTIMGRLPLE